MTPCADFCECPSSGGHQIEVPPFWVGTRVSVRVTSSTGEEEVYSLGLDDWGGRTTNGVFQPGLGTALVVAGGNAFWFHEDDRGVIAVRPDTLRPVVTVLEEPGCLVLTSNQQMRAWCRGVLVDSGIEAMDGFRDLVLAKFVLTGSAYTAGEWRPFSWRIG